MTPFPPDSEPSAPGWLRAVSWVAAAGLLAVLIELLTHRSTQPSILGLWSPLYFAILMLHILAVLACGIFALRRDRHPRAIQVMRSFGTLFLGGLGGLSVVYVATIYFRSGDGDFKNLAVLLLDLLVLGGLAVAWRGPRLRRPLMLVTLLMGGLLLPLVLIELTLALFPALVPAVSAYRQQQLSELRSRAVNAEANEAYQTMLESDPVLGFTMRPNATAQVDYIVSEGGKPVNSPLQCDAWGFFNPDFDPSRPYDVVTVGDSFVMGPWPAMLGTQTGLRVANLGRSRYCPPQYTEVIKRYALALHPKLILYCLYLNDADESADYEDWRASGQDWFVHKGGLWFGARDSHPGRALLRRDLIWASRLYSLGGLMAFKARLKTLGVESERLQYDRKGLKLAFDPNAFGLLSDPKRESVQRGLEQIRSSLGEAREICRAAQIELAVVLMPAKELVYNRQLAEVAPPEAPLQNVERLYARYRELGEQLGLRVFDLTEAYRQAAATSAEPLYWEEDIHWNPQGLALMARQAAEIVHAFGIQPQPSATAPAPAASAPAAP